MNRNSRRCNAFALSFVLCLLATVGVGCSSNPSFKGGSTSHVIAYLEKEAPSGSPWAKVFGGSLKQGYNLVRVRAFTETEMLIPSCATLAAKDWDVPETACRAFKFHGEPAAAGAVDTVVMAFENDPGIFTRSDLAVSL
jgi:hypothetical protein